jgi:hypothetical protein
LRALRLDSTTAARIRSAAYDFIGPLSAARGGLTGVQVDPEAVLMAAVDVPHDHIDFLIVIGPRREVFDIGHSSGFEGGFPHNASVVAVEIAGADAESAVTVDGSRHVVSPERTTRGPEKGFRVATLVRDRAAAAIVD